MLSTHRVEIVPVTMEPHPNADTLSIVKVFGFTVCVRTEDWAGVAHGAYIPPDSVVPDTPAFAFLDGHRRIRARKLRGIVSMGLLMPAPEGVGVGDDVAEALGVTHYEPPMQCSTSGEDAPAPSGYAPCYDVEALRRYAHLFAFGEHVWVSEKIHGASSRFRFDGETLHVGSRNHWKRDDPRSIWWQALRGTPGLEAFCREFPGWTVYGEVYGQVQDLKYGVDRGVRFAAFDLLQPDGTWTPPAEAFGVVQWEKIPWVPIVSVSMPFDAGAMEALANGPSLVPGANHCREGIVVRPLAERTDPEIGRVQLKLPGTEYLTRK